MKLLKVLVFPAAVLMFSSGAHALNCAALGTAGNTVVSDASCTSGNNWTTGSLTITSTGQITDSSAVGLTVTNGVSGGTLSNSGSITTGSLTRSALSIQGAIGTLTNNASGIIGDSSAGYYGVNLATAGGSINSLVNYGSILAVRYAINLNFLNQIDTLTNIGTIKGGATGIFNGVGVAPFPILNNAQGVGNANGPLSFYGEQLPTKYNVIIRGTSSYGQLSIAGFGPTTPVTAFNIYGNAGTTLVSGVTASTIAANRYLNVLQGFSSLSGVTGTTGTYNGFSYSLVADATLADSWDLLVTGSGGGGGGGGGGGSDAGGSSAPVTPTCSAGAITSSCQNLVINNGGTTTIGAGATVSSTAGAAIVNTGSTTAIINNGTVTGGIQNNGTIGTLQNAQGGASSPLAYSGALPGAYVVVVNGSSNYGQLSASGVTGVMGFGVAAGSVLSKGTYSNVLMGFNSGYLSNTSGTAGGYLYKLSQSSAAATNWNLIAAASVADTNSSLVQTTNALQGQFGSQSNAVITGMTYDCNVFGANNVCISAGGRGANNSAQGYNTASAVLIAAYRASPNVRLGAYVDQNLSASNPNGIISASNGQPMGGLFAVWNDKLDGTGTEIKASVGYNNKNMTVTRPVVGTSEAGSGSTGLTSQGVNAIAKYGFGVTNQVVVSPYVGVRYMTTNMGSYSEGASASVLYPLSYASMSMNATTALAGLGANFKATEDWIFSGSAGVEGDISTSNGSYTVTNASGLTPVSLNPNPVKTRPTAMLAAYYNLDKNTQLGLTGLYRTDSVSGMSSTTGMATVTFGM